MNADMNFARLPACPAEVFDPMHSRDITSLKGPNK